MMKKSIQDIAPIAAFVVVAVTLPATLLVATASYGRCGAAALKEGRLVDAGSCFDTAAHLSPWRDDLWERAASAALASGDAPAALERINHLRSRSLQGYLTAGAAYLRSDDPDMARQQYEQALSRYGPEAGPYAGLAAAYRQQGRPDHELESLEAQIRWDPDAAGAHYRIGQLTFVASPDTARAHLARAAALDPSYSDAVETLEAAAQLASAQHDEAVRLVTFGRGFGLVEEWLLASDAFTAATVANPGNGEAWAWRGEAKYHLGLDGGPDLDRALSVSQDSATVRGLRGLYSLRAAQPEDALREFLLASALEPGNSVWQASIADAHAAAGDLQAALAAYQRATELAPNDARTWLLLSAFCAANGIFLEEIGLPAALTASKLDGDDPAIQDVLGWSYLLTGRLSLAEGALRTALAADPSYAQARLHLALTYSAQGRDADARAELLYIIGTDPNSAAAEQAELLLQQLAGSP
jgi:tetratricopeptide (TPR) repeat protein